MSEALLGMVKVGMGEANMEMGVVIAGMGVGRLWLRCALAWLR
jgi:hypothetical protein